MSLASGLAGGLARGGGGAADALRIAFCGDPQIGSGVGREQADILRYRRQSRYLDRQKCNAQVDLGDLINNGTSTQAEWQHAAYLFVRRFVNRPVYPMIGNHDVYNNAAGNEESGGSAALTAWLGDGGRGEDVGMPAEGLANLGCYTADLAGAGAHVRLILWNSDPAHAAHEFPSKYTGTEHDDAMTWLQAAMLAAKSWKNGRDDRHVVLCMHHRLYNQTPTEDNNQFNIPNGLEGFTYNNPRTSIISWIRDTGVHWVMSGHTAANVYVPVAESSGGAGDDFVMTETAGTSIVSISQENAVRILEFRGSRVNHRFVLLDDTPEYDYPRHGPYQNAVMETAEYFWRFGETMRPAAIDECGSDPGAMRWAYGSGVTVGEPPLIGSATGEAGDAAISMTDSSMNADGPHPNLTGAQSFECLIKWTDNDATQGVMSTGVLAGAGSGTGIALRITAAGVLQWNVADADGDRVTIEAGTLVEDQVHHVLAVYDAEEDETRLYLDGTKVGSAECVGHTASASNNFLIGVVSGQRFSGTIDEASFHRAAITDEQASARAALALSS